MPALTSLAFHREKQTINTYDSQRPKSLFALRQAAKEALEDVEHELHDVELVYLKPFKTHEEFIQEHMISVKTLFNATQHSTGILRKVDLEVLVEKVNALGQKTDLYREHVDDLKSVGKLVHAMNPQALQAVIQKVQKVLTYMDKYCLSFYNGPQQYCPDPYLDTPFSYHAKRKEHIKTVQNCLKAIGEKVNKFNSLGLTLDDFSTHTEQLARRMDCRNALFFLLFPESCRMIREARDELFTWLEEDKEYVEGLENDLKTINQEETDLKKRRVDVYNNMVCHRHQLQLLEKRHDELDNMLKDLFRRKAAIEDEYHESLVECKKVEMYLERAKTRLDELRHNADHYPRKEFLDTVREQRKLVRENTLAMPERQKTALRVEDKLAWFKEREETVREWKIEIAKLEKKVLEFTRELRTVDERLEHLQKMKIVMKNIFNMKTDVGTMKKVFHNLQMESRLKFLSARQDPQTAEIQQYLPQDDRLTLAIRMTSYFIEKDWFRLYFLLPFHPPRGMADVEEDVKRINTKFVRGSLFEHAMEALNLWRRLHTRANLASLMQALQDLGRKDVVQRIEKKLERMQREMDGLLPAITRPIQSPTTRLLEKRKSMLAALASVPEGGESTSARI